MPLFRLESEGREALKSITRGHRAIASVNGIAFRQTWLWEALTNKPIPPFVNSELPKLHANGQASGKSLGPAFWEMFAHRHRTCESQLAAMRQAFREVLDYKVMRVNDRLQRGVLGLAVAGILLALVALLPERTRADWFLGLVELAARLVRKLKP